MSSSTIPLMVTVFFACSVEMVEALTIVVAVGVSRGWRSALEGVVAAITLLALLVGSLGQALIRWVPLSSLREIVGALLLIFGIQWLRKAILRASGHKEKHDEDAIFAKQIAALRAEGDAPPGRDRFAFAVAFKGVFLEGLEVVVIVLTLGTADQDLGAAAIAASLAVVIVAGIGAVVTKQLARVPENAMKLAVGLMLVTFGTFWTGEGLGVNWPGSDLALPALVCFYTLIALITVKVVTPRRAPTRAPVREEAHDAELV